MKVDVGSFEEYLEAASLEDEDTTLRVRSSGSGFCTNYHSTKGRPRRS